MGKKFILAVIGPSDIDNVMNALVSSEYEVTRFSSMGGFLRRGNVTVFVGVDAEQLETALALIRSACTSEPQPEQHRATLFVLDTPLFETI